MYIYIYMYMYIYVLNEFTVNNIRIVKMSTFLYVYIQGSTNLIFACTDFCARKMVLHAKLK